MFSNMARNRAFNFLVGFSFGILCASTIVLKLLHDSVKHQCWTKSIDIPSNQSSSSSSTNLISNTISVVKVSDNIVTSHLSSNELAEVIQRERRSTLDEACMRFSPERNCQTSESYVHGWNLYSKKYKASFCDICKCGYTSWLGAVFVMEDIYSVQDFKDGKIKGKDVIDRSGELRLFATKNAKVRRQLWDASLKVILVRHPFTRIVSAYYDKLVNSVGYKYKAVTKEINEKYRHLRQNVTQRNKTDDGTATFEDFVNFLVKVDTDKCDVHWKSFQGTCQPCKSQYDYIAKFESLENDMEYLRHKLNLSEYHQEAFFLPRKFKSNVDLVEKTFEKIPKQLSYQLYEKYKIDFEMFGYRKPKWLC